MFDLTHTYFPYLVSISSCFVASRHQSRRSPTFYSLKLLKTKKQTNKQPKISQTEWCRKISELQNPSLRGIPLGGPRDMASNNLQLFYLFLFLFYCCDYSVSVRTFYMCARFIFTLNLLASQTGALVLAIPSLCLWLLNIINVSGRRGGYIIYMGVGGGVILVHDS